MANRAVRVPIEFTSSHVTVGGYGLVARRIWLAMEFERRDGSRTIRDCLIDTGAPMSVVPHSIHHAQYLRWQALSDSTLPPTATWSGVDCDVGRCNVWLPLPEGNAVGPVLLIAKFPRTIPHMLRRPRVPVPVLLGLNFFADMQAKVQFQCHEWPNAGSIVIRPDFDVDA